MITLNTKLWPWFPENNSSYRGSVPGRLNFPNDQPFSLRFLRKFRAEILVKSGIIHRP